MSEGSMLVSFHETHAYDERGSEGDLKDERRGGRKGSPVRERGGSEGEGMRQRTVAVRLFIYAALNLK